MIRIRIGKNEDSNGGSKPQNLPTEDRRQTTRRQEDYFWLERLGEMSEQALVVFDSHLNLEFANHLTLSLFGMTESELQTLKTYDDLIEYCVKRGDFGQGTETTLQALSEDLKRNARLKARETSSDLKIRTPTGKHVSLKQSYGRDGRMLLAMTDITESHESKEALELALKVGRAGYWSVNFETGEWKLSSKSMLTYFGKERVAEAEKSGIVTLIHPDDRQKCDDVWQRSLETGENWDIRSRLIGEDGSAIWFRGYGVPQFSDNGHATGMFCFYVDISEEMRLQNEQLKAIESTQTALKAKNKFLAHLSHEVRTPLNAVIGISDALIHHHQNAEIRPKLELIQNSAEKIIRIVNETLDHSKMEEDKITLDPKPTNPIKCVETVCRLWEEKAAENNTKLSFRFGEGLPEKILMDGFRYEQCLNNLISNAVKFSPGGQVNVILTSLKKEGHQDRLVLAVKDTGIGMSQEEQKQIFEAYTQADESISSRFGGTGLGMTITKQLIELMGGSIKVKSEKGQGSVFVVVIPFGKKPKAQKTEPTSQNLVTNMLDRSQPEQTPYSDLKILVVDDNETNHLVVCSLLETVVSEIVTANDGREAIEKLKSEHFDLVLMDIHMPVMDGIEATLSIRSSETNYAGIPIIALTADPQYQQKRLCRNIGMDEALAKPVKLDELLKAFDSILHKVESYRNSGTILLKAS